MELACFRHPEESARARCVECGSLLCETCRAKLSGRNYCRPCVPANLKKKLPGRRSPTFAAILSLVPGLGQLFVGEKLRGLVFAGSALALGNVEPMPPATVLLVLYVFNLFDAWSLATERNARVTGVEVSAGQRRQRVLLGWLTGLVAVFAIARETIAPELDVLVLFPVALGAYLIHASLGWIDRRKENVDVRHA
jgi:hypothetical protein